MFAFTLAVLALALPVLQDAPPSAPVTPEQAANRAGWQALAERGQVLTVSGRRVLASRIEPFILTLDGGAKYQIQADQSSDFEEVYDGEYLRYRSWLGSEVYTNPGSAPTHARLIALLTGKWLAGFEQDADGAHTTLFDGDGSGELKYALTFGKHGRLESALSVDGRERYTFASWFRVDDLWLPEVVNVESQRAPELLGSLQIEDAEFTAPPKHAFSVAMRTPADVSFRKTVTFKRDLDAFGKLLAVPALLGEQEYWFYIATCNEVTIVDQAVLETLESEVVRTIGVESSDNNQITNVRQLEELRIGGMRWKTPRVIEMDLSSMKSSNEAYPIGGVLGMDFLLRCAVRVSDTEIEVKRNSPIGSEDPEWAQTFVLWDGLVPLLWGECSFGGRVFTGGFALNTFELYNAGLLPVVWDLKPEEAEPSDAPAQEESARADWVNFFGAKFLGAGVRCLPKTPANAALSAYEPIQFGTLGMDLLEHFEYVLDLRYSRLQLRLLPSALAEAER